MTDRSVRGMRMAGAPAEPDGIVFDFDGVLVESTDVKTEAFRVLFAHERAHVDAIVAYHIANGGMSRFEKFRSIYRDILDRPLDDKEFDRLCEQFADLVRDAVMRCPEVPGAEAYLRSRAASGVPMYVASATPEPELRAIVSARGLSALFSGVYGSPRSKTAIAQGILDDHAAVPSRWWFIGDALHDLHAADATGMTFIARVRSGEPDLFPPGVRRIADLTSLCDAVAPR